MFVTPASGDRADYEAPLASVLAAGVVPLMLRLRTVFFKSIVVIICVKPFKTLLLKAMNYLEDREKTFALIERKLAADGLPRIDDVASTTSLVRHFDRIFFWHANIRICFAHEHTHILSCFAFDRRLICARACLSPKRLFESPRLRRRCSTSSTTPLS